MGGQDGTGGMFSADPAKIPQFTAFSCKDVAFCGTACYGFYWWAGLEILVVVKMLSHP
jgi:hypothetical protein